MGVGFNSNGQLGDGTVTRRLKFVKVVSSGVKQVSTSNGHTQLLKTDGSVWAAGSNTFGQLGDGTKTQRTKFVKVVDGGVKEVRAGQLFSVLLNDKHELCVTGWNKKCYPRPGPCYSKNGGCHSKRTCIADNKGSVSCGDCPAPLTNDGPKGCKGKVT